MKRLERRDQGRKRQHIELMSVRELPKVAYATVYVPEGRLKVFEDLVEQYLDPDKDTGKGPKNKDLIDSIESIGRAVMDSFWTDDAEVYPADTEQMWWEVWLRSGEDDETRKLICNDFRTHAEAHHMKVGVDSLPFPDRTVVLAYGTAMQLASSVELLDCVAELRRAKELTSFFTEDMTPADQGEWSQALVDELTPPDANAPAVCILDTGLTSAHPLLAPATSTSEVHTIQPAWGAGDSAVANQRRGHGTEMAGLCLYGDLTAVLASAEPVILEHRLESVKILPPARYPDNDPALYGAITRQGTHEPEVVRPNRRRVFALAVTTKDFRDRGRPSSWSAELDLLAFGDDEGAQRLFVVSAGNLHDREQWTSYPDINDVEEIHDPAQAWNVLTIGAYTEKALIPQEKYPDWRPIARPGGLSPSSSTSVAWATTWPTKPDIVMEGGNAGIDPATGRADALDDLSLLTTHWDPAMRQFVPTADTSAACALGARLATILAARYPAYWPETLRALLVHSADWTEEMWTSVGEQKTDHKKHRLLLRRYGWGVPSMDRASWSAANELTLVFQGELRPFGDKNGSHVPTKDMHIHALPWPTDALKNLPLKANARLRVTLSYFVEPSPGRRGPSKRHQYASHGLRFALKKPLESLPEFEARVSKDLQKEGTITDFSQTKWILGETLRNRGSILSDWCDDLSGPELAQCGHLAVFPTGGWWKERTHFERWRRTIRYSLIVSIDTEETDVDLYTPVANQIIVSTIVKT